MYLVLVFLYNLVRNSFLYFNYLDYHHTKIDSNSVLFHWALPALREWGGWRDLWRDIWQFSLRLCLCMCVCVRAYVHVCVSVCLEKSKIGLLFKCVGITFWSFGYMVGWSACLTFERHQFGVLYRTWNQMHPLQKEVIEKNDFLLWLPEMFHTIR